MSRLALACFNIRTDDTSKLCGSTGVHGVDVSLRVRSAYLQGRCRMACTEGTAFRIYPLGTDDNKSVRRE